jgi:hypothetical protein
MVTGYLVACISYKSESSFANNLVLSYCQLPPHPTLARISVIVIPFPLVMKMLANTDDVLNFQGKGGSVEKDYSVYKLRVALIG